jgi:hypothetical protein
MAQLPCTKWLPLGFAIGCAAVLLFVTIPVAVKVQSKGASVGTAVTGIALGAVAIVLFVLQTYQSQCAATCGVSGANLGATPYGANPYDKNPYDKNPYGAVPHGAASHPISNKVLTWDPVVTMRDFKADDAPIQMADATEHTAPIAATAAANAEIEAAAAAAAATTNATIASIMTPPVLPPGLPPAKLPFWAGLPNPVLMAEERQRFWAKPETPEVLTRRRQTQLLEAAAQLRLPRDGSMTPVGPPALLVSDPTLAAGMAKSLRQGM